MAKIKVTHEGKEIEVELPPEYGLKSEIVTEAQETFERGFMKRADGIRKAATEAALADDTFKSTALKAWGIDPTAKPIRGDDKDEARRIKEAVEGARGEWEQATLKPLQASLSEKDTKLKTILDKVLQSEIVSAAAAAGVQPYLLKSVDGGEPAIVGMLRNRFGFDPESDQHLVKKGDRWAVSSQPKDSAMYMGVAEFVGSLATNKDWAELFAKTPQKGPGVTPVKGEKGGTVVEGDMTDPLTFGRNAEAIAKGEITVNIPTG